MANPNPLLDNLKPFRPQGDEAMSKVIGTRYPVSIAAQLEAMLDKQAFIRAAVAEKLERDQERDRE
jgi:hypothetical protein